MEYYITYPNMKKYIQKTKKKKSTILILLLSARLPIEKKSMFTDWISFLLNNICAFVF